jgi:hypothetical protein
MQLTHHTNTSQLKILVFRKFTVVIKAGFSGLSDTPNVGGGMCSPGHAEGFSRPI